MWETHLVQTGNTSLRTDRKPILTSLITSYVTCYFPDMNLFPDLSSGNNDVRVCGKSRLNKTGLYEVEVLKSDIK